MCILIAEIIMLIGGLYAIFAGKLKLTNSMQLEGTRARIAGVFLALPLPLAFGTGLVIGFLIELDILPQSLLAIVTIFELAFVLVGLLGAYIYARSTQPKVTTILED